MLSNVVVDQNSCIRCGVCVKECPAAIFFIKDDKGIDANGKAAKFCIQCGHCMAVCPSNSINVKGLDIKNFKPVTEKLVSYEDFLALQMNRRSIRQFKAEHVSNDIIEKIIEAARFAPTAKNSQTLSWLILNGREKVLNVAKVVAKTFSDIPAMAGLAQSLEAGQDSITRNAPQLAIIYGPADYKWGQLDAAIATNAFDLAALTLNVGTCWGGFVTTAANINPEVAKIAGLKEGEKIFAAMMFGHPDVEFKLVPQRNPAKITFA